MSAPAMPKTRDAAGTRVATTLTVPVELYEAIKSLQFALRLDPRQPDRVSMTEVTEYLIWRGLAAVEARA